MLKLKRDKDGNALLNTTKDRLLFIFGVITLIITVVSLFWAIYWVMTGKNLIKLLIEKS